MKLAGATAKCLLALVLLLFVQALAGALIPIPMKAPGSPLWWLLSNAIVATVLTLLALRSPWRRWKLAFVLALIPAAIQFVNLVEGGVFLDRAGLPWRRLMGMTALACAMAVPLWALVFRGKEALAEPGPRASFPGAPWRLVVSSAAYVLLYLVAGMIVFPFVRDFYATQTMPSMGLIVSLQFFLRGPVFAGLCLLLMRGYRLQGPAGALAVGLAFTLLSGVAPMIQPNPFFPDSARWAHFWEITCSNFVFGTFVAWLWRPAPAQSCTEAESVPV